MLKLAVVCGGSLALTLLLSFLPWYLWLIPALVLSVLLPYLCIQVNRKGYRHSEWIIYPENIMPSAIRAVSIEPSLLIGKTLISAEVWLPFDRVEAEHFRSRSGAMLLAAAIAHTDERIAAAGSSSGCAPEEIRQWEQALGIVPDNLKALNPKVDDATVNGFPGAVVRDGSQYRAYFVGGPTLIRNCKMIMDGTNRAMTEKDLERLGSTPAGALCYATSPVEGGKLTGLCYLGAVRPVIRSRASAEALSAGEKLQELGFSVRLQPDKRWDLQVVRDMGIEWPEDEGMADTLEVHAATGSEAHDFSKPVISLLEHANRQIYGRLLVALMGFALWPCSLMTPGPLAILGGLICLCMTVLLCDGYEIRTPPAYRMRAFLFPLLPSVLIPVAAMLFLGRFTQSRTTAGAMMILSEALLFDLYLLFYGFEGKKRPSILFISLSLTLLFMLLTIVMIPGFDVLSFCFGMIAGSLAAAAVLLLHRYLSEETAVPDEPK